MLKEKLYWNKIEKNKNEFILKSENEEIARLKFDNYSKSKATIETANGNLDLNKTGFPNPTTIIISISETEVAKLTIRPSTCEGKIQFSNSEIIDFFYYQTEGEIKFKSNGITGPTEVLIKPILNGKDSCIEVKSSTEKYSDNEIIAMSVLGLYLILVEFEISLKGTILFDILTFLGLVAFS